jgi:hypothetical protein
MVAERLTRAVAPVVMHVKVSMLRWARLMWLLDLEAAGRT